MRVYQFRHVGNGEQHYKLIEAFVKVSHLSNTRIVRRKRLATVNYGLIRFWRKPN